MCDFEWFESGNILTIEGDPALAGLVDSVDAVKNSALAGAVGPIRAKIIPWGTLKLIFEMAVIPPNLMVTFWSSAMILLLMKATVCDVCNV